MKTRLLTAFFIPALVVSALSACQSTVSQTSQTASLIQSALAGEQRSAKNKARDQYRHPVETLSFFGLQPNMTVVEMVPGGGWYTEILAPVLKDSGKLIGAMYPDTGEDNYYSHARQRVEKKLASDPVFSKVELVDFTPKTPSKLADDNSVDMVLTFRNLHNWGEQGIAQFYQDAFKALKPGGVLGVVEHRMPASMDWQKNRRSGYVPEQFAIDLAKKAGFVLAAKSEINANPKDTADHPAGVWTLPPVLRLKEKDRNKYLAIGESDRMTLKFIKPAAK